MFSHRPVFKSSLALLLVFFVPSASVVVAQQDDKNATLMTRDDNNDSSRVMTNYNTLRKEGQGFWRAVSYFLGSSLDDTVAQGAQIISSKQALSFSALMVPTLVIFDGQIHQTPDDWVGRYWDDGSSTLPTLV